MYSNHELLSTLIWLFSQQQKNSFTIIGLCGLEEGNKIENFEIRQRDGEKLWEKKRVQGTPSELEDISGLISIALNVCKTRKVDKVNME